MVIAQILREEIEVRPGVLRDRRADGDVAAWNVGPIACYYGITTTRAKGVVAGLPFTLITARSQYSPGATIRPAESR
jgi:hypothetical protein